MVEKNSYLGWYQTISQFFVEYSFAVFGALVILAIGILLARKISNWTLLLCERHQVDITLANFIASFIRIGLIIIVAIMALAKVGVSVTPLLAAIGAISLGAGLAVQGQVSNYSAGLSIILTRTFVIGDTITVSGVCGVVKEIHLGYTILIDQDETQVLVPNRHIVGEVIKNSQQDTLVIIKLFVDYQQDIKTPIEIIKAEILKQPEVNQQRSINVGINKFQQTAIEVCARFWVKSNSHICVEQQVQMQIYDSFQQANIQFASPHFPINFSDSE